MSVAERLRDKAHDYELQAAAVGEQVPWGTVIPAGLKFEIQRTVYSAIAVALTEVANAEDEREAA